MIRHKSLALDGSRTPDHPGICVATRPVWSDSKFLWMRDKPNLAQVWARSTNGHLHTYTQGSPIENPNPNTPVSDRTLPDCPTACVIAQQHSSATIFSLHFSSLKEKFGLWFNLLATDFFQILAHPVFKMWVIQKPNKVALWNKRHFEETKMEIIQHV